ncbi:DUF6731 family protein [Mammaliicoccus sciuri]|uniref:DUF6731 family protein n=1 Tax=Mammaliicoccus sciuri TaxID=1296 RepID=UPI001E3A4253|nr:DUF6731 family protein [Mammaliicoccus sciuri]MCD8770769.1 hypothetical protein [Mammaliicoccus sciuri]
MAKNKTVTFNLFRPFIKEHSGKSIVNTKTFDFNIILRYMIDSNERFSTYYQDEQIAIYSIRRENFDEGLFHLKIVKFRTYDLPSIYTPIENLSQDIIEEEFKDNEILKPFFNEENLETDGNSTVGESLNILFDEYNNTLIIQSNQNCTTISGLTILFSSILTHYFKNEPDAKINLEDEDSALTLSFAPIIAQEEFEKINELETVTELEYIYEDNGMNASIDDNTNMTNDLQAGTITTKYHVDSRSDKSKSLNLDTLKKYLYWFKNEQPNFKKMNIRGRKTINSNIDLFEFVDGRLKFSVNFRYDENNLQLNSEQIFYEMERKYLGYEGEKGYREKSNY